MAQRKRKQHGKRRGKSNEKRTTFDGRDISDARLEQLRFQLVTLPHSPATQMQRKQLLIELASIFWGRNEYPPAIDVWQQLLKIAEDERDTVFQGMCLSTIATCYAHGGNPDAAIEHAKRALVFNPDNVEALMAMGMAYDFAGDYANAILWLARTTRYHPEFQSAYQFLGAIYARLAQYDEAERYYKKSAALSDGTTPGYEEETALTGLANMYVTLGRYEEAQAIFKKLIRRYPDRPLTYNNLGNCYLHMGRLNDAQRMYEKRLRMRADDALWTTLGLALIYRTFSSPKALQKSDGYFQQALAIYESQRARMLAGRLIEHDALGAFALIGLDREDALTAWEAILTHPDSQIVGPGTWQEWLFSLNMLAEGEKPPSCLQAAIALHAQYCPADAPAVDVPPPSDEQ